MKHLIIGSGIVGKATGIWLEAHEEDVTFNDIKRDILIDLKGRGYKVTNKVEKIEKYDIVWICTHEDYVEGVIKQYNLEQNIVVIRSTTPPGEVDRLTKKYKLVDIAHIPEFLKAKTFIEDIFNVDRVVIGSDNYDLLNKLKKFFAKLYPDIPIITTNPTTSEMIKLASNGWLATQISYWNEILIICKKFKVNPQEVANGCTLDKRISKYGTKMIDEPFSGFCLPKDVATMQNAFRKKKVTSDFLEMVSKINKDKGDLV